MVAAPDQDDIVSTRHGRIDRYQFRSRIDVLEMGAVHRVSAFTAPEVAALRVVRVFFMNLSFQKAEITCVMSSCSPSFVLLYSEIQVGECTIEKLEEPNPDFRTRQR